MIVNGTRPVQYRHHITALGAGTLLWALPLTSCGDYDPAPRTPAGSGGPTLSTGMLNTAGQTAMGGAAGSALGGAAGNAAPRGMGGASGGSGTVEVTPVEADCEAVEPCGGDVVGTWAVAGACLPVSGMANMAGFGLGCTEAPVTGALEVTGTWSAKSDGTFTDGTTTTGDSQLELSSACLNVSGTTTTCDRLDGALQALGYASVTCADAASGGCTCTGTVQQTGGMGFVVLGAPAGGSYTTANNVITTAGRNPRDYSYCASGNRLTVTPQGVSNIGSLTGTIVFEKQ